MREPARASLTSIPLGNGDASTWRSMERITFPVLAGHHFGGHEADQVQ
jgi:hypothetical protein